jgi:hypothetical protein
VTQIASSIIRNNLDSGSDLTAVVWLRVRCGNRLSKTAQGNVWGKVDPPKDKFPSEQDSLENAVDRKWDPSGQKMQFPAFPTKE